MKIALGAVAPSCWRALALANVALFFWLAPRVGEPGASRGILAGAQILIGAIVLAVALRHAATRELGAARNRGSDPALADRGSRGHHRPVAPVARSADRLGRNVALGLDIATTLLGFLRKK